MITFRTLVALGTAAAFASRSPQRRPPRRPRRAAANPANMPKCEKPDPHPGRLASPQKLTQWNKSIKEWQDCMKKDIAELQAKADAAVKEANAAVADSNAAIASYNDTVKEFQAQVDALK